jgi:hypothetical protein
MKRIFSPKNSHGNQKKQQQQQHIIKFKMRIIECQIENIIMNKTKQK